MNSINRIHFIGIGGIGMSGLARLYLHEGAGVSGSDAAMSAITQKLEEEGVEFFADQGAHNITDDIDMVVYTEAMPGEHNRLNAALAYEALKATSLSDDLIFEGLATFPGVEGRLQYLGERDGVKIYNDNNATTPQATIEALKAVGDADEKNVVLLCGGSDKDIDASELALMIEKYCAHVVLYSGTGTEKLKATLSESVSTEEHETLKECVEAALATSAPGNVFLFSPAFASFGKEYKNEYDRNDQFIESVNLL